MLEDWPQEKKKGAQQRKLPEAGKKRLSKEIRESKHKRTGNGRGRARQEDRYTLICWHLNEKEDLVMDFYDRHS